MLAWIELSKPCPRVRQSDPMTPRARSTIETRAVVAHLYQQLAISFIRADVDRPWLLSHRDPMMNRILHQGLQQERRDRSLAHTRIHRNLHMQSIAETSLLNLEITLQQIQ